MQEKIKDNMHMLEEKIGYTFKDISYLAASMKSVKIKNDTDGINHREYENEKLALLGDKILDAVIIDFYYKKDFKRKKDIDDMRQKLTNNIVLHNIAIDLNLIDHAYNNLHFYSNLNIPKNEKVTCSKHDPYIEAIIAAIYYDSNYETVKKWIKEWLLPKLIKFSK